MKMTYAIELRMPKPGRTASGVIPVGRTQQRYGREDDAWSANQFVLAE